MAWIYGAKIAKDGDDFAVTVRDLPEVMTFGATMDEARDLGLDAIAAVVAHRIEKGKELAIPSALERDEEAMSLPLQTAAKASIYIAWRKSGLTKREVAKRMNVGETEVRRILDPRHGTRLDALEAAAKAVGARITLDVLMAQ